MLQYNSKDDFDNKDYLRYPIERKDSISFHTYFNHYENYVNESSLMINEEGKVNC